MWLLFLFHVHRVLAQSRRVFLEAQFFTARLLANGVVVVTRFLAYEVHDFKFLFSLAFGHRELPDYFPEFVNVSPEF